MLELWMCGFQIVLSFGLSEYVSEVKWDCNQLLPQEKEVSSKLLLSVNEMYVNNYYISYLAG